MFHRVWCVGHYYLIFVWLTCVLECDDDNITSYADDTTPYSSAQDTSSVISELQRIAKKFFDWCKNNYMKTNPEKFYVILSSKGNLLWQYINYIKSNEKLLGTTLDSELEFEGHINKIC